MPAGPPPTTITFLGLLVFIRSGSGSLQRYGLTEHAARFAPLTTS